eukprot:CAMPEP_0175900672 /NCGR_PEP_ID=MMETSP0108-20121206/2456_1 /TAXON_ID=195067 ORGANISM="Goniomonas pacifica, Strain CCMP1869" /NCGR_SAMPLE_ID=MMETSP0108 /ASSEMBLY_ACC=CAM_ASM_000204 /LENGTH=45 /DNA_ID= /DNA_START= /DNA_END= /DNA_ORIENTATION=
MASAQYSSVGVDNLDRHHERPLLRHVHFVLKPVPAIPTAADDVVV